MNNIWNMNKELRGNMLLNDTMNLNWICINMIMYKYLLFFLLSEVLSRVSSVGKESASGLEKVMQMCQQPW